MNILIKPIITEKATNDSELNNRYTFQVNVKSNKVEIKKAIEKAYGVSVEKVRTINVRPDRNRSSMHPQRTSRLQRALEVLEN